MSTPIQATPGTAPTGAAPAHEPAANASAAALTEAAPDSAHSLATPGAAPTGATPALEPAGHAPAPLGPGPRGGGAPARRRAVVRGSRPAGSRPSVLGRVLSLVGLIGALVPPLYLLSVSLMGRDETVAGVLTPATPRWENYGAVLRDSDLPLAVGVSVLVAVLAGLLSLAGGLAAAWSIARLRVVSERWVGVLLSPWLLPPVVAVVPLFLLLRLSGLLNSIPGLVLVYALVNLPVVLWLLLSFVAKVPQELIEAARLDGAGEWRILASIGLPLLAPALVAVGLIVGLQNYHEFLLATFLTQGPESRTAPVVLSLFYGDRIPHVGRIAAAGVITALPPVLAALLLQRRLVSGLTHGASR
jgi:multiple sugar transport system permease protein